jgi:uncharacterized membrane protein YoaK (UPF0700 family)
MSKNYVLRSTQESRDNGTTSILAIVETILLVALTWGVAYYYDFYTHIYTAIAIAPFLLLKTDKSIEKAIEWFLYEHKLDEKTYYKDKFFWILLTITALLSFLISYFFSKYISRYYRSSSRLIKLIFMLWITFLAWHLVSLTNQYVLPELPKIFGML